MAKSLYLFIITILVLTSCNLNPKNKTVNLEHFSITVPDQMKNMPPDTALSELVKLVIDNKLFISIDDNMEDMMKPSKNNKIGKGLDLLNFAYDHKFRRLKRQYEGFAESEKSEGKFKDLDYITQSFTCNATKSQEAFFEYRMMIIGGHHYEFIITGLKSKEKEYKAIIEDFWNSIVVN